MKNGYLNEDVYVVQYPDGKELCFAQGQIQLINDYNIKHSVSTHPGSSGSPILIQSNDEFKIIGIHKQGNKNGKNNLGTFMKNILNDINNINIEENNLNNYIICEYHIKKKEINQPIQILNSYEEAKRKYPNYCYWKKIKSIENEKEIKENCEIYLNNKKIDFCYKFIFKKKGKYTIKFHFK